MLPTDEQVEHLFTEVKQLCAKNNITLGWIDHSVFVSNIASILASKLNLDERLARLGGLLHDIGRGLQPHNQIGWNFHEIAGYKFLLSKGYTELARFCITHGFIKVSSIQYDDNHFRGIDKPDIDLYTNFVNTVEINEYDKIIQLADSIAVRDGYVTLEQRTIDLIHRYPQNKEGWILALDEALQLKKYFDEKLGCSVYNVIPQFFEYSLNFKYDSKQISKDTK